MKYPTLQELLEAGVHFGHKISRGNPRMKPFIYGSRDGVHIIDLTLSEKYLKEACVYVQELGKTGGTLLFVGTKNQSRDIVEEQAKAAGAPFLTFRWIGGFLTNFEEINKNIKKLKELREAKEKGELSKYTKKEQLLIDRKVQKMFKDFTGVLDLESTPDAIFVVDAARELTALREAQRIGIKVVAIADSNSDPSLIDYPIPGNDDAIKSIKILVSTVASAYAEGKNQAGKIAIKVAEKVEKKRVKDEAKNRIEEIPVELADDVAAVEEIVEKEEVKEAERVVE